MSDIIVRDLKKEEYALWDKLVESSPQGTIFHNSSWLSVCAGSLNKKLKIYGCFENNQLIGGCSIFIHKSLFFKTASSIIEMTPYGGIVMAQSPSSKVREQELRYNNITRSLFTVFDSEHLDNIRLVNSPDVMDVRPFIWNRWQSQILYTYYLDLNNLSISKDARWSVKNAQKNGIIIEKSEDILLFYELFNETYLRQGLKPPVSDMFFKSIFNMLQSQNKGEMWFARAKSGDLAASEIVIYDDRRAHRWSAASHIELRKTGAPALLLFDIIQDLKKRGLKEINLMAANTPRLAKFISSFNPRLVPYYAVEKSATNYKLIVNTYRIIRSAYAKQS